MPLANNPQPCDGRVAITFEIVIDRPRGREFRRPLLEVRLTSKSSRRSRGERLGNRLVIAIPAIGIMIAGADAQGGFVGSQVFPSRSSQDNARSSPARTRSSISRCGSRNVCGTNTGDGGFGVPAPLKSRVSGGTDPMGDFLFILFDLTEYIVDLLCAPVGSRQRVLHSLHVLKIHATLRAASVGCFSAWLARPV
jgi:hypothetical protein